jgi:hypothetical protein
MKRGSYLLNFARGAIIDRQVTSHHPSTTDSPPIFVVFPMINSPTKQPPAALSTACWRSSDARR